MNRFNKLMTKYTIIIEDISEKDQKGYCAQIYGTRYPTVIAMGDTIPDLFESIQQTLEEVNS